MKTKEKQIKLTLKNIIYAAFAFFAVFYIVMFCNMYLPLNKSVTRQVDAKLEKEFKISNANEIDINEIIYENT